MSTIETAVATKFATDLLTDSRANLAKYQTLKTGTEKAAAAASLSSEQAALLLSALKLLLAGFGVPHQWDGTKLRIQTGEGTFGPTVDLKGDSASLRTTGNILEGRIGAGDWSPIFNLSSLIGEAEQASSEAIAALKGGADPAHDTLAKLGGLVDGKAAKGANADITSLSGTTAAPGVDVAFGSTTVASASTVDLGALTTVKAAITGTTAITSFGTKAHAFRMVRFSGVLTLTHNSTSLILPGAANIITAAGDTAILTSDGSGNWTCWHYQRAVGAPIGAAAIDDARIVGALPAAFLQKSANPVAADIPAGTIRVHKNTTTGRLSLWANDGGTIVDLLTLATA